MTRRIGARVARLESERPPALADLVSEAARFGTLAWSARGWRLYTEQTPAGARLAVIGGVRPLLYEVLGIDVEDLR